MNKIEKFQKGLFIPTWNKFKNGMKNLRLYRSYIKDIKRFDSSVQNVLDHYSARYPVLHENYFSKMGYSPVSPFKYSFDVPQVGVDPIPHLDYTGIYYNKWNQIGLSAYNPYFIRKAWSNPTRAIKRLHGNVAHETLHSVAKQLGFDLSEWSKVNKYYAANPNGVLYDDLTYAFDSRNHRWKRSPEEFLAEMSYAQNMLGVKPGFGFSQWPAVKQKKTIDYLSNQFDFTPEDTEYFLHKFSQLGFKHGGKI